MKVLIAYGTTDGQTERIARRISVRLTEAGHDVVLSDIRSLGVRTDCRAFDAVIVGGSLHAQGYQRRVKRFIRENLAALHSRPTAFISVCLAVVSRRPEERKAAEAIPRRFVAMQGWTPGEIVVFAGALAFTRYGFLRRFFMKRIAAKELGEPVDPTCDREFTDWAHVDAFAAGFARRIERRRRAVAVLHPEVFEASAGVTPA